MSTLTLMGCSSALYVPIKVDPPNAMVYVNGEKVGLANKTNLKIEFGQNERVCVQAIAPGFKPLCKMLTVEDIDRQLSTFREFDWHLDQDR
ncbi:MAG TPA: PEGA domain-containing protein [Planctomycetota bacterium]|nr:PEGA domain-containing protein [Planctomycetota bacterium]